MEIQISLKELDTVVKQAGKLVATPEAENAILTLLEMREQIDLALEHVKHKIAEDGLKLDPTFKSIQGDKIKAGYRVYGSKYGIDKKYIDELPEDLYKTSVKYTVDSKAVDEWLKSHKSLPLGITMTPRAKQISIRVIGEATSDED
ncbi:MAG: hypothetical protein E6R04_09790 [Spirochaetes bacterium]|nr:MAG: hypothetical protein E6R04_09790 [Spirochaetota bacterium]